MARELPAGFLIGCASAAHQVEGGLDNDWTRMERERPEKILDGSRSGRACDHYARYAQDLQDLAALHNTAHRFSVEWSRVEPRPRHFDERALQHYADVARTCRRLGMEPVVTLHHFTLPRWLADRGGVAAPEAPERFARYAEKCTEALTDTVEWWITINEPAILAYFGYLLGEWPPEMKSLAKVRAAMANMLRMHAAAAGALRETARRRGQPARISIAHHERRLRPRRANSPLDRLTALAPDFIFNRWFLRSAASGRMLPPIGVGQRVPELAGTLDYIGLNYYCEEVVSFDLRSPGTLFSRNAPTPGLPQSTFGWAIDPAGLTRALTSLWEEFGLPLLITENGVADRDDELRPGYIVDHLSATLDAIDQGVDVRGYLHWTALDNFEWTQGYSQKFGLFSVDRDTMERRAKPSAALFGEICGTRLVPAKV